MEDSQTNTLNIYIDESGNTGLQLHDPRQPVYSIAAISVAPHKEEELRRIFEQAKKKFRLQGNELKGKNLLLSSNGQRALKFFAEELKQAGIIISLLVFHKPYHVVGWIMQDCFDYVHNPAVTEQWTWDSNLRIPAQNTMFNLARPQTLQRWWQARIQADAGGMRTSIEQLIEELKGNLYGLHLGKLLSKFDAEDLAETTRLKVEGFPTARQDQGISPNVTAFIGFLQGLDQDAQGMNVSDIHVIHDEQTQFSENFHWWVNSLGNLMNNRTEADRQQIVLPDGRIMPSVALVTLKKFSMEKSLDYPGIQIADCFASLARAAGEYVFRNDFASMPRTLRQTLLELQPTPHFPESFGPDEWQQVTLNLLSGKSASLKT